MKNKKLFIFIFFILPLELLANTHPSMLSADEAKISHFILEKKSEQLSLLEKLVNINSGTQNIEGIKKTGKLLQAELETLEFSIHWVELPTYMQRGPTLIAERKGTKGKKLLLIGHLDTVFPKNSPFQKFERHGEIATGPGVIDDKGGIVIILYALKALQAVHALDNSTITVVLTGDEEESGKPTSISRKSLIDIGKKSDIALDFEPTYPGNAASIGRRGYTNWFIEAEGKEGHSSHIFNQDFGDGAIFEIVRILNTIRTTINDDESLTFNPGVILGGTQADYDKKVGRGSNFGKNNIIAKTAIASGDLRYLTSEQRDEMEKKITTIVAQHLPGTSATIEFKESMPPMPVTANNLKLLAQYSQISQNLGYGEVKPLPAELRGGGDISHVAAFVSANLVGIGATGTNEHSQQETLEINSLVNRSQRAALLIYALTR